MTVEMTERDITEGDIVAWRRRASGLTGPVTHDASEVVRRLLAVQAQDHQPTLWSIGQRCAEPRPVGLDRWFDAGEAVRTHVLRPTWHLVAPEDLRWLLTLTAPRVQQVCGTTYRQCGFDAEVRHRAAGVIAGVLADAGPMTRAELGAVLVGDGYNPDPVAIGYLLMHAELEQVICSGPMAGRKHTYALMDDRVPGAPALAFDDARARLIRRYLHGHGPASVADIAWWSSLTMTSLQAGIDALAGELIRIDLAGTTYWAVGEPPEPVSAPYVDLLPTFDEYVIGFSRTRRLVVPGAMPETSPGRFTNTVVLDGLVRGGWSRRLRAAQVDVTVTLDHDLSPAEHGALLRAADRYGSFLDREAHLRRSPPLTPSSQPR